MDRSTRRQPNILIIMSDQHGAHFSGPYGHPIVRTPNVDRLAAAGVVFENAYTSCPICVPARMSFMTGRYVQNLGIWDNGVPLREDAVTWAHRLRNVGYRVALSGKMHFRGFDQCHGFDAQLALDINAHNRPMPPDWSIPLSERDKPRRETGAGPGRTKEVEADDRVAAAALAYLQDQARRDGPWALVVGFVAPHPPYVVPRRFYDLYPHHQVDLPIIPEGHIRSLHPFLQRTRRARGYVDETMPEEVVRRTRATYYGQVTYADEQIGRMIQTLEQTGQLENTLVVYTADHGEMLGEHGLWFKSCFFEQATRIPLIVSWPRAFPRAKRVAAPISLVDLTATICDVAAASDAPEGIPLLDGKSLLPLIAGREESWPSDVFAEYYANLSSAPMAMLRRGRFKLNYYHGEEPELYDLETDPGEFRNLAGDPTTQAVREELTEALLDRWDPLDIERRVRDSQAERRFIEPYLFLYLNTKSK